LTARLTGEWSDPWGSAIGGQSLAKPREKLRGYFFVQALSYHDAQPLLEEVGTLASVTLLKVAANLPSPMLGDLSIEVAVDVMESVVAITHY
jgi:hypothetical protein